MKLELYLKINWDMSGCEGPTMCIGIRSPEGDVDADGGEGL